MPYGINKQTVEIAHNVTPIHHRAAELGHGAVNLSQVIDRPFEQRQAFINTLLKKYR